MPTQEAEVYGADTDVADILQMEIGNQGTTRLAAGKSDGANLQGLCVTDKDSVAVPAEEGSEEGDWTQGAEGIWRKNGTAW